MKREAISNIREREKGKHISNSTQNNTKFVKVLFSVSKKKKTMVNNLKDDVLSVKKRNLKK